MAYATAKQKHVDLLVVGEPNKKRVCGDEWIKDSRVDVAILLLTRNLEVSGHNVKEGHLVLNLKNLKVVCCYISPNISMQEYKKAVDMIMNTLDDGIQSVIIGDVNAKSPHWGSPVTDEKGEYWMDWISSKDMVVHNTGVKPTFIRGATRSYIDVTISTNRVATSITHWEVLESETLTEHQYIYFEILGIGAKKRATVARPMVEWEAFRNTLEMITRDVEEIDYVECARLIRQAYKNSVKYNDMRKKNPYWWTQEIGKQRGKCVKNRRVLTRLRKRKADSGACVAAIEAYRGSKKDLSKLIKQTKKKFWDELCTDLENDVWGGAYKIILKRAGLLAPYDVSIDRRRQIVTDLFLTGAAECCPGKVSVMKKEEVAGNIELFTETELKSAASTMRSRKAPGLDGIPPDVVKMVADCRPEWMLEAMNKLLMRQEFPEDWKMAKVVLIPKAKKPPELSSSYRPLCMLNAINKLLEALVRNRLQEELEEGGGLHPLQFGFRRGRSTVDALEAVKETANEYKKDWCALITLDVRNAFNTANHSLIVKKLEERNISKYLINMVTNYLTNRRIWIGKGEVLKTGTGVPQGSVLGPTLWNVLYDDVLGLELVGDTKTIAFADDLALLVGARDEYTLVESANESLAKISSWMREHKLTLAPEKTEAIIVRGRRDRSRISFQLEEVEIRPAKTIKYLGFTIDDRLTFGRHIEDAAKKAQERISKLSRILPNMGGPSSGRRAVLCGAVCNIVLYGAPVWEGAMRLRKSREVLVRTQRSALLRIASAYRTAATMSLQVITGTIPIDLVAMERVYMHKNRLGDRLACRTAARELSMSTWQRRWTQETVTSTWTKRLIKDISEWVTCKHRVAEYYLTQVLTAHGSFRAYAKRFGKDVSDECIYCASVDTAEHTIFECEKWTDVRQKAWEVVGTLTPDNLVAKMIGSKESWRVIHRMVTDIMARKETDEIDRQKRIQ